MQRMLDGHVCSVGEGGDLSNGVGAVAIVGAVVYGV